MIRKVLPLLFGLVLVFAGCSNRNPAQKRNEQKAEGKKTAPAEPGEATSSPECTRGEPEALLSSQSDFQKSSPREALETVRTDSRIKLTIHHFGCTHYALDFEFTWPDPRMPEPQIALREAASLLEKLPLKEEYRPMLRNLVAAMLRMSKEPYKQPVTMSETETLTATTPALNMLRVRYDVAL